jgi:type I restriction enzyme S subunit
MAGDSKEVARAHLAHAGVDELPDDWDVVTLGDLFTEDRGIAVGVMYPGDHDPIGVPLIKAGDLNGSIINPQPDFRITEEKHREYRRTALEGGELLMTLVGNVGQCAVVPPRMAGWNAARAVAVMRLADPSDTHFVQQCLLSRPLQHLMDVWCNTTVQATLNLKEIRQLPLPWPPKQSRDAIAKFGRVLDDKIELNRRMNATLEAMARALFQSWFVDFDPVRAKLDGRPPTGMDKATADLFPDSFQESPLGDIPKGWNIRTLGDIARNVSITFDFNRMQDVVFINTGDVMEGDFLHVNRNPYFGLPGQAKKSIQKNDILFSEIRPANKRYAYVDFDSRDYVVSTKFMIIRGSREIHPRLLYRILTRKETLAEFQLQAESRSGTFPQITFDSINHLPIILPPTAIQEAFRHAVGCIDDQIKINKHQSRTLATLRDTLLPKLLSGKLSLADLNPAERKHAP